MSKIDTGLGWSCSSDYYADTAGTFIWAASAGVSYDKFFKSYNGASIAAINGGGFLISTERDYAIMNRDHGSDRDVYSAVVNGITWYISGTYYSSGGGVSDFPSFTPTHGENTGYGWNQDAQNIAYIIDDIITQAGVRFADKIPTTDYVKAYIEGVEVETARRVKANAANIGSLSSLTTAAKTDLVSAINELESTKQSKTTSGILTTRCKPSYANFFEPVTWNGLTSFDGNYIWSDDENIYYSNGETQYVLNKSTSTWTTKTWNGLTNFSGEHIWTDGENIYYSYESTQYVLDKSTSTWTTKTWNGLPLSVFYGEHAWTDGETIYYSYINHKYVLNKSTSTWTTKTWGGSIDFYGNSIWTDGRNIYCLDTSGDSRVLEKSTSTWFRKTWNGLTSLSDNRKNNIWTDGESIYYSKSNTQYVLNGSTWEAVFSFPFDISGQSIWSDGENIYYSNGETQYVLKKRNVSAARK